MRGSMWCTIAHICWESARFCSINQGVVHNQALRAGEKRSPARPSLVSRLGEGPSRPHSDLRLSVSQVQI